MHGAAHPAVRVAAPHRLRPHPPPDRAHPHPGGRTPGTFTKCHHCHTKALEYSFCLYHLVDHGKVPGVLMLENYIT